MIDIKGWDFNAFGQAGFGEKDLAALEQMGATEYQIFQAGEEAKRRGLNISHAIRGRVARGQAGTPWDYGGHGNYGFGMADVAAVGGGDASRADLDTVLGHAKWAQETGGLRIGPGVRAWVTEKQAERDAARRKEEMAAIRSAYTPPPKPNIKWAKESEIGKSADLAKRVGSRSSTQERKVNTLRRQQKSGYVSRVSGLSGRSGLGINLGSGQAGIRYQHGGMK